MRKIRRVRCQFQGPTCEGDFIKLVPSKKYCDACHFPAMEARRKAYQKSKSPEYWAEKNRRRQLMRGG